MGRSLVWKVMLFAVFLMLLSLVPSPFGKKHVYQSSDEKVITHTDGNGHLGHDDLLRRRQEKIDAEEAKDDDKKEGLENEKKMKELKKQGRFDEQEDLKGNCAEWFKVDSKRNFYEILGVEIGMRKIEKEVKKAYRKQSKTYHPDRIPPHFSWKKAQEYTAEFRAVEAAYNVLVDKETRRLYNTCLGIDTHTQIIEVDDDDVPYDALDRMYLRTPFENLKEWFGWKTRR